MEKNKVTSYLLYAIGEIVLVVIGILIAVSIDNWNEQRKTEAKIKSILKEIQEDIATDIESATDVLKYYDRKDSLIRLALTGKLRYEDYQNDHSTGSLRNLTYGADHFKIHDNGFKKIMMHSDNINPMYRDILSKLNEMYVYQKYEVDKFDERMDVITDEFFDNASKNLPFFHTIRNPKVDDEIIKYFLTNPFYKNELINYRNSGISSYSRWITNFARKAQDTYLMIRATLADTSKLPAFIPQNRITPSKETLEKFTGTFKIGENSINLENYQIVIQPNEENLYMTFYSGDKRRVGFITQNLLDIGLGFRIELDSNQSPIQLNFRSTQIDAKFYKIK